MAEISVVHGLKKPTYNILGVHLVVSIDPFKANGVAERSPSGANK
jgi:hypothetical protein